MAWISLFVGGLLLLYLARNEDKQSALKLLTKTDKTAAKGANQQLGSAINLTVLSRENLTQKVKRIVKKVFRQLGSAALAKFIVVVIALGLLSIYIDMTFVRGNPWVVLIVVEVVGFVALYNWLQNRERRQFEEAFPDALNMLTSAVSSGESLMHAIMYVGKTLDTEVGKEFKLMGERLQMGETPESVFRKACKRFPYPTFHFFVITVNANLQRGGQLKEVITRLNRLMFDARTVEKKKYSLTSEARTSAKIVAAIPFLFLWMLQYLSPENYEYVMFNPDGRVILYYVLISEFIGIAIVRKLMKGVEI
ncbi:type II secretion system F family protein [Vibrio panuliri]|uniref:Pilus assembly protein TadB n=1 Tax=Vibrio panuliri TaxID=1381081 RepID=A0ABX3FP10_9VIBR|nr:type II secretion system F family protein [Vibrio panuliri]KAB1457546.1 pilus assembly protein TadB [Vibrio panuliri]OLQ95961.1 pilus assembly protein TadB [Vibrio panuliri]